MNIVFRIFSVLQSLLIFKNDFQLTTEGLSIHFSWFSQNQTRFSILIRSVRPSIFVFLAALWADWLHFFARRSLQFYGHWRWFQIIQKNLYLYWDCMTNIIYLIWDLYGLIYWLSTESSIYILSLFWFYSDTLDLMFQSFQ